MKNLLFICILVSGFFSYANLAGACDSVAINMAKRAKPTRTMSEYKFKAYRYYIYSRSPSGRDATTYTVAIDGYNDLQTSYRVTLENSTCRKVRKGRFGI